MKNLHCTHYLPARVVTTAHWEMWVSVLWRLLAWPFSSPSHPPSPPHPSCACDIISLCHIITTKTLSFSALPHSYPHPPPHIRITADDNSDNKEQEQKQQKVHTSVHSIRATSPTPPQHAHPTCACLPEQGRLHVLISIARASSFPSD